MKVLSQALTISLPRVPRTTATIGVCAAALLVLLGIFWPHTVLTVYLPVAVAVAAVPIGCLAIVMMMHLMDGRWRRQLYAAAAAGTRTLPMAAILMVPVLLGVAKIYPWIGADHTDWTPFKTAYLNPWFFAARSVAYFSIWIYFGERILRGVYPQRATASVGLIIYTLTVSLAAVDWMMSLDPDFASSIYGLIVLARVVLSAFAVVVIAHVVMQKDKEPTQGLGALLLCLLLIWIYMHAMQFIIIWAGDRPDEISWYIERSHGIWQVALWIVTVGGAALPFAMLLSSAARRKRRPLCNISALVILSGVVENYWLCRPAFLGSDSPLVAVAAFILAVALIVGLWLAAFVPALETAIASYEGADDAR